MHLDSEGVNSGLDVRVRKAQKTHLQLNDRANRTDSGQQDPARGRLDVIHLLIPALTLTLPHERPTADLPPQNVADLIEELLQVGGSDFRSEPEAESPDLEILTPLCSTQTELLHSVVLVVGQEH